MHLRLVAHFTSPSSNSSSNNNKNNNNNMDTGLLDPVYWIDFSATEEKTMTAVDETTYPQHSGSMFGAEEAASPYLPWRIDQTPELFFDLEAYLFDSLPNTDIVTHWPPPMLEQDCTGSVDSPDVSNNGHSSLKSSGDQPAEFTSCLKPGVGSNIVGNNLCVDNSHGSSNGDGNGQTQRFQSSITAAKRGVDDVIDESTSENDRAKRRKTAAENKPKNKPKKRAWCNVHVHMETIEFRVADLQNVFHWKRRSQQWSSENGELWTLEELGSCVLASLPWVSVWVRPHGDGFPVQVFWDESQRYHPLPPDIIAGMNSVVAGQRYQPLPPDIIAGMRSAKTDSATCTWCQLRTCSKRSRADAETQFLDLGPWPT
ncbi:hypothetical protein BKA67DRAFT_679435 [Truncatella angustata]|uniref:Uncharacterized protein n=1 Tax=Truncatella angustata TaxID=152316 RepID=A0A9P8ZX45_9PEZI|nr:uncharacterized protein BKA67DRAFT_679435 [Truncatella angustata]KAH6653597.1 hypothetical protein BKA67DRAFT_679435 [Truncatella angustata]